MSVGMCVGIRARRSCEGAVRPARLPDRCARARESQGCSGNLRVAGLGSLRAQSQGPKPCDDIYAQALAPPLGAGGANWNDQAAPANLPAAAMRSCAL